MKKSGFWKNSIKWFILLIVWLATIGITIGVIKYLDNKQNEVVTYTDKEVKDNITIFLTDWHRTPLDEFDASMGYDSMFYNFDIYVRSNITTDACITVTQYNDGVETQRQAFSFKLLKDATVVQSSIHMVPTDFLYSTEDPDINETFEEANLSWEVSKIQSGECK